MTWGDIEDLFVKGAGATQDAHDEKYQHLNDAHRKLCAHLELPELYVPDASVQCVDQQDYIDVDDALYHVYSIVDTSTGRKLDPEPGGFRGRDRYIEDGETRPPLGSLQFYVRQGSRIWLRDTPQNDAAGNPPTLKIAFRFHPEWVDSDSEDEHPIPPNQYDMLLVRWALASYFSIHPPKGPDGALDYNRSSKMMEAIQADLETPKNATTEENYDRRQFQRQMGYSFNVGNR